MKKTGLAGRLTRRLAVCVATTALVPTAVLVVAAAASPSVSATTASASAPAGPSDAGLCLPAVNLCLDGPPWG